GHHINITNDATHHLLQERRVANIRSATLLKVVLGMLNSGRGGRVLLGVSEEGVVEGMRMTLHQRDTLMLGVSRCLKDIRPSVLPCDQLVRFIRVESE
ncbi:Schlafen AAA domain, partial [Trinorchestia longiramus]